ncbi:hypothetical protein ACWIUD_11195 [Helicobacter sp. 23-1044]
MALPFVLGLIIGGGAVYAYNNREQLAKKLNSADLKAGLKSGEKKLRNVSNALKAGAKTTLANLKSEENKEAKPKRTRAKSTGIKRARRAKNTPTTQTQNLPQNPTQNPSVDAQ